MLASAQGKVEPVNRQKKKLQTVAKKKVKNLVTQLNKAIESALKTGVCPEISIVGESEDWPEFLVEGWKVAGDDTQGKEGRADE